MYKPKGVKMPSNRTLLDAHIANPHGCGFVSSAGKSCKSLDFAEFMRELRKVRTDEACIIHFRLATHGSIKTANCHPFSHDGYHFAHNGILSIKPLRDKTDSETAFITRILPTIKRYGFNSPEVDEVCYGLLGYSKFALMHDGHVKLYGDFICDNGVYYSNLRFRHYYTRYFD